MRSLLLFVLMVVSFQSFAVTSACLNGNFLDNNVPNEVKYDKELCYPGFNILYSYDSKNPVVVGEFLTPEKLQAGVHAKRSNDFRPDEQIPAAYRAMPSDYNKSGYDKGHQAPAGDACSFQDKDSTFLMSNMVPQTPALNRVTWRHIEEIVRQSVILKNTSAYVLTGVIYEGKVDKLRGGEWIPSYSYKAVRFATGEEMIYVAPNTVEVPTAHAFIEDPLRILRLYRFKAQLGESWTIDFFTEKMARSNVDQLKHISPERKWKEMDKALKTNMFHDYMRNIAELWLVPELSALKQVQQPKEHHPEGNAYIHTLMCLKIADDFDFNPVTKFAVLCHDFGKAVTWKKSNNLLGHEADGVPVVEKFCGNLRVPNEYRDTALAVTEHHTRVHCLVGRDGNKNAKPRSIMKLLEESGCLRNEVRLYSLVDACLADAWGRGQEHREDYPQRLMLVKAWKAVKMLDTKPLSADLKEKGKSGLQIGEAIRVARIQAIRDSLR